MNAIVKKKKRQLSKAQRLAFGVPFSVRQDKRVIPPRDKMGIR